MAFGYRRSITIDHTKVPATQTDFPVLISFTNTTLKTVGNGGHVQNANGYDIVPFTNSTLTTQITGFELERYNASTGEVIMWVKVASVSSSSDTVIYIGYGDSTISTFQGTATSTWDSNYKGVWHLPDGTTLTASDSTSNANNGTLNSTPAASTGQVGGGMRGDGSASYVSAGRGGLTSNGSSTVSFWAKEVSGAGALKGVMGLEQTTSAQICTMYFDGTRNGCLVANASGSTKPNTSVTITNYNYYCAVSTGSARPALYVNGASNDANDGGSLSPWIVDGLHMGRGFAGFYANVDIDEFRISDNQRTANWITAEYNNQSSPSTFHTIGSEVNLNPVIFNQSIFARFQAMKRASYY